MGEHHLQRFLRVRLEIRREHKAGCISVSSEDDVQLTKELVDEGGREGFDTAKVQDQIAGPIDQLTEVPRDFLASPTGREDSPVVGETEVLLLHCH